MRRSDTDSWTTVRDAWRNALYGPDGFYRRQRPAGHFSTSPHVSTAFAEAIASLARGCRAETVWDVGAGGGELLEALGSAEPDLRLVGVDIAPRPADLPRRIEWLPELPGQVSGLVIANELLDNVPCDVVALDGAGQVRLVEVRPADGAERLGAVVSEEVEEWLAAWWPLARPGDRAEVGITREDFWAEVCSAITDGICVAIDYGHSRADRPAFGTLTSFRAGRQVRVGYAGDRDITAHVAMDALCARVPGTLQTQRDALRRIGPPAETSLSAADDPQAYLAALARAGERAELTACGGLGDHIWLVCDRRSHGAAPAAGAPRSP